MKVQKVSEYEQQAIDFLLSCSVTFRAEFIGNDCPTFCEDAKHGKHMDEVNKFPRKSHIHGKHYRCTFERRQQVSEADGKPVYSSLDEATRPKFTIDFWNSYADEEQNYFVEHPIMPWQVPQMPSNMAAIVRKYPRGTTKRVRPSAYDVLACLTKNDPGSFEEFCSEYGYDSDSRQAENVWRAVREEWEKIRRFFHADEIEKLREIS